MNQDVRWKTYYNFQKKERCQGMNVNYWNEFADDYDEYVIDTFTYGAIGEKLAKTAYFGSLHEVKAKNS